MISLLLLLSLVFAQSATAPPLPPTALSQVWESEHQDYGPTPLLDHATLQP